MQQLYSLFTVLCAALNANASSAARVTIDGGRERGVGPGRKFLYVAGSALRAPSTPFAFPVGFTSAAEMRINQFQRWLSLVMFLLLAILLLPILHYQSEYSGLVVCYSYNGYGGVGYDEGSHSSSGERSASLHSSSSSSVSIEEESRHLGTVEDSSSGSYEGSGINVLHYHYHYHIHYHLHPHWEPEARVGTSGLHSIHFPKNNQVPLTTHSILL